MNHPRHLRTIRSSRHLLSNRRRPMSLLLDHYLDRRCLILLLLHRHRHRHRHHHRHRHRHRRHHRHRRRHHHRCHPHRVCSMQNHPLTMLKTCRRHRARRVAGRPIRERLDAPTQRLRRVRLERQARHADSTTPLLGIATCRQMKMSHCGQMSLLRTSNNELRMKRTWSMHSRCGCARHSSTRLSGFAMHTKDAS